MLTVLAGAAELERLPAMKMAGLIEANSCRAPGTVAQNLSVYEPDHPHMADTVVGHYEETPAFSGR